MASYVETQIYEGLCAHLSTLTLSPALPVSLPGKAFTPDATLGYLRVTHLPNRAEQITLGGDGYNQHRGIFQIDVLQPSSAGIVVAAEIAGAVAAHFKRGTNITREGALIRVIAPPSIAQALQSPPYIQIPVSIAWAVEALNPA